MKIKFETEIDTREDDEIGLLIVELLQAVKERIDLMNEDDYDEN